MRLLKSISDNEMVLSFLQAETASHPEWFADHASRHRLDLAMLADRANLADRACDIARGELLGMSRGYGQDRLLFRGFPGDVSWHVANLNRSDVLRMRYLRCKPWTDLTGDTCRLVDADAVAIASHPDVRAKVDGIAAALRRDERMPPIIAVAESHDDGLIILEGCHRATALCRERLATLAIVGFSPLLSGWDFF